MEGHDDGHKTRSTPAWHGGRCRFDGRTPSRVLRAVRRARAQEMTTEIGVSRIDRAELRRFISEKYREVATNPELGFHFHTGRPLALMLGYPAERIDSLPAGNLASFAGTGNPFLFGDLRAGERVVDVGC